VISGATKAEQVVSNVSASDWQLTAEELQEVDAIINL
jgi:aryl-alcohol dehydrogenase-like predicted oxidoreductase